MGRRVLAFMIEMRLKEKELGGCECENHYPRRPRNVLYSCEMGFRQRTIPSSVRQLPKQGIFISLETEQMRDEYPRHMLGRLIVIGQEKVNGARRAGQPVWSRTSRHVGSIPICTECSHASISLWSLIKRQTPIRASVDLAELSIFVPGEMWGRWVLPLMMDQLHASAQLVTDPGVANHRRPPAHASLHVPSVIFDVMIFYMFSNLVLVCPSLLPASAIREIFYSGGYFLRLAPDSKSCLRDFSRIPPGFFQDSPTAQGSDQVPRVLQFQRSLPIAY